MFEDTTMAEEHIAVRKFREYLRIDTEHPTPDLEKSVAFLLAYAKEIGLHGWTYECVPGEPIVGMTLEGSDPSLPSIILYSHMDVVPTFPEHWNYPPYSAHKDADGNIWARGTQDMKSVGVQYMEALRQLAAGKGSPPRFRRTIHVLWGPDEEIGGHKGMELYVHTEHFKKLNVGFALDEGLASEDDTYRVYYGQRLVWWLKVTCPGKPGHGSRFIEDSAGPKLNSILQSVSQFREQQKALLDSDPKLTLGDVTSANITIVEGGVQVNVIPDKFVAYIDMRETPTVDLVAAEERIKKWCAKAGSDVTYEFIQKNLDTTLTSTSRDDPYWAVMESVFEEERCKFTKGIIPVGTDARYLRALGIAAIGFSPIINTPVLLHDHNEFLNERVFLRGVGLYAKLIERLAQLP